MYAGSPVVPHVLSRLWIEESKVSVPLGAEPVVVWALVVALGVLQAEAVLGEDDGSVGVLLDDDVCVSGPGDCVDATVPKAIDDGRDV